MKRFVIIVCIFVFLGLLSFLLLSLTTYSYSRQDDEDLKKVLEFQKKVKSSIAKASPAFVFFVGAGSGVVISSDGYVITNHHVARGKDWTVRLTGGKTYKAKIVGFDPKGDIALLKLDKAKDVPYAELGDSDALKAGDHVFAIGQPFLLGAENWEPTVTFGIVSGTHLFREGYNDAICTDAQINPGNSGGPLFNLEGKVIGINGRIDVRFFLRVSTGMGYAIPSNQIKRFLKPLKEANRGVVYHGEIGGIKITTPENPAYREEGGWDYGDGVLVVGVDEKSSADKAGFLPGDLITEIEGYKVYSTKRFKGVVKTFPAGDVVKVKLKRKDEHGNIVDKTLRVLLTAREQDAPDFKPEPITWGFKPEKDDPATEGVKVKEVEADGPADKAGIKVGDTITHVVGERVKTYSDFKEEMFGRKPGESVKIKLVREGKEIETTLKLKKAESF